MNIMILKVIITVVTWLLLYFGILQKPYLKFVKSWGLGLSLTLLCIVSFCWGFFVGEMIDLIRNH